MTCQWFSLKVRFLTANISGILPDEHNPPCSSILLCHKCPELLYHHAQANLSLLYADLLAVSVGNTLRIIFCDITLEM